MNLEKYPLEKEQDDVLLTRLSEECSEVIKANCKIIRFGYKSKNMEDLFDEIKDVELIIKEVKRRWK